MTTDRKDILSNEYDANEKSSKISKDRKMTELKNEGPHHLIKIIMQSIFLIA